MASSLLCQMSVGASRTDKIFIAMVMFSLQCCLLFLTSDHRGKRLGWGSSRWAGGPAAPTAPQAGRYKSTIYNRRVKYAQCLCLQTKGKYSFW